VSSYDLREIISGLKMETMIGTANRLEKKGWKKLMEETEAAQ
jgi:hypothetical protein